MLDAFPVVTWPSLYKTSGEQQVFSREQLLSLFKESAEKAFYDSHPGWSPCRMRVPSRDNQHVETLSCLVLDFDSGDLSAEGAVLEFSEFSGVVHTTRKSTRAKPRLRVVLFLSREVTVDEHAKLWKLMSEQCPFKLDKATKDPSRFWFLPSLDGEGKPSQIVELGSELFDVDMVLGSHVQTPPPSTPPPSCPPPGGDAGAASCPPPSRARAYALGAIRAAASKIGPHGSRNAELAKAARVAGNFIASGAIDEDEAVDILYTAARAAGLEHDEIRRTIQKNLSAGKQSPREQACLDDDGEDDDGYSGGGRVPGEPQPWMDSLRVKLVKDEREEGGVKKVVLGTAYNIRLILANDIHWKGAIGLNEMTGVIVKRRALPPVPFVTSPGVGPWLDSDSFHVRLWFSEVCGLKVSSSLAWEVVQSVAAERAFCPLSDYLGGLSWDGVPRLDKMAVDIFGAEDTPYFRMAVAKWMIAGAARGLRPGAKVDSMIVLEGAQGIGKSRALSVLGGEWFFDSIVDMSGKDGCQSVAGRWVVELAELSSLKKAEIESVKAFVSAQVDRYRPAYGKQVIEQPRRCVFAGTTNETGGYLLDTTGNRRFWPVKCGDRIDVERLERERDQYWAEAVHRLNLGELWYLTREVESLPGGAAEVQESRIAEDPWESSFDKWASDPCEVSMSLTATGFAPGKRRLEPGEGVTTSEVLLWAIGMRPDQMTRAATIRIGAVMRRRGWRVRRPSGNHQRTYHPPSGEP